MVSHSPSDIPQKKLDKLASVCDAYSMLSYVSIEIVVVDVVLGVFSVINVEVVPVAVIKYHSCK